MAKILKKLNNASGKVIEDNFLKQNPTGLPDEVTHMVVAREIPEYKRTIFVNNRDPGVALHFHYHSKTHPLKHYTLYHGYEHELPVEVITHLENCGEPQYGIRKTEQGLPEHFVKGFKYIFSFRTPKPVAA